MRAKAATLVELLGAMAVGGLVMVVALAVIYQVLWGTSRTNSQVTALMYVNQASLAIKKDMMMSQSLNLTDGNPTPEPSVSMNWTDLTIPRAGENITHNHSSAYILSGTDLLRTHDGTTHIVGRYITSVGFTLSGRMVTAVITATGPAPARRSENITFSVYKRQDPVE